LEKYLNTVVEVHVFVTTLFSGRSKMIPDLAYVKNNEKESAEVENETM